MRFINYFDCLSFNLLGQLLVVARHPDTSPSSCYELGLIPDQMVIAVGINHYSTGRDYEVMGLYFYAWEYKEDPRLHRTPTDP